MSEFADAFKAGIKASEKADTKKLVDALSECSPILDFPPEIVCKLLSMKAQDVLKLHGIMQQHIFGTNKQISVERMAELLDLARVARIMEENEPAMAFGPTGPVGPTGPRGPTGISAKPADKPRSLLQEHMSHFKPNPASLEKRIKFK
jgi:hypothetical protein